MNILSGALEEIFSDFGCSQWQVKEYCGVRTAAEEHQRSGDWRTKTAQHTTSLWSVLQSVRPLSSPAAHHRQTVSSCQANTHLQSRLPSPAHLLAAPWPCRSREMSVES